MIIRSEQMEVFRKHALRDYVAYAKHRLRTKFSAQIAAMSEEELERFVWDGTNRANSFGVTRQLDAARFLELQMRHGAYFYLEDGLRGAAEILRAEDLDGAQKIAELDALEDARAGS